MTTIDRLPSERELEALANGLFPEYNTAECADGIEKLVTQGDTSVIDRAAQKAGVFFSREAVPFQSEINRLDGYARAAEEVLSEASSVNADEFYPEASPLDGFSPVGTASYTLPFTDITSAAQISENELHNPKYSLEEKDLDTVVSELDGFGVYREEKAPAQPKASGYSPVVVSQAQSGNYSAPKAQANAEESGNFRQSRNNSIIIGTKTLEQIRRDFPILGEKINGHDLVWLDNGATTQRPQQVIDRLSQYYTHENSNVHRGAHTLAARSTDAYEGARQTVADFIGAPDKNNIVFVRGTTEGINLVANAYVKQYLQDRKSVV